MRPYVIILAATGQEASKYARRADLPKGRWRHATSAGTISGLRRAELHELPSYAKRSDRHAIEAVLRYGQHERLEVTMPARTDGATEQADLFLDGGPTPSGPTLEESNEFKRLAQGALEELGLVGEAMADLDGPTREGILLLQQIAEHGADALLDEVTAEELENEVANQPVIHKVRQAEARALTPLEEEIANEPAAPVKKRRTRCDVCNELVWSVDDPRHDATKHFEATIAAGDVPSAPEAFDVTKLFN